MMPTGFEPATGSAGEIYWDKWTKLMKFGGIELIKFSKFIEIKSMEFNEQKKINEILWD